MGDPTPRDRFAIDGKIPPPADHAELLVIGAGPAGIAASIEAAQAGRRVVLVDENPVAAGLMGLDVPLFYGQRMTAAVQASDRMVERIVASSPALEQAYDAGVDVRLGVIAWGAFAPGPALQGLPGRVAGLADSERSWLCGFDSLILATGARDLVLGFDGADVPGVMGARALHALLQRYDAFSGRRLVILGSGDLAAATALLALDRGLEVVAMIEVLPAVQASPSLAGQLAARGVTVLLSHCIVRAEGDTDGLAAAWLCPAGDPAGPQLRLDCDTLCLAIGAVPAIELADVLGCDLVWRGDLGGHVARTGAQGAASVPGVFLAGDCAGILDLGEYRAAEQGRAAAAGALAYLSGQSPPTLEPPYAGRDTTPYRLAWMRALLETGGMQAPVCLCEDVSRADLLGVQPPCYLGDRSLAMVARSADTLLLDGPLNPDQIKRLTRAGMGPCQGRRCREQIALLLALSSNLPLGSVPLASYRAPVRPLPLSLLADTEETQAMRDGWDVWFGIPTQWIPYADIGTAREAELLRARDGHVHL